MTELEIKLYDNFNMFSVLQSFGEQVEEALIIGTNLQPPDGLKNAHNIIITGLGGSAIGGDLLRSFLHYKCRVPIYVNRNYYLPEFADENTLVIVSSYSGNTEESLSAYEDAKRRGCKVVCSSSGGKLLVMAESEGKLLIRAPRGYQPRCALAYSFFPLLILMNKIGFAEDYTGDILKLIEFMKQRSGLYSAMDDQKNNALRVAKHVWGKIPVIYSSSDLLDIANLRWRCQVSENAKCLAFGNFLPEMNHNEICGWQENPEITKNLAVISLIDREDSPKIIKRMAVTLELIRNNCAAEIEINGDGSSKLERLFDVIYLGDWVSFYLAIMYKIDPTPVERINILKNKLTEN